MLWDTYHSSLKSVENEANIRGPIPGILLSTEKHLVKKQTTINGGGGLSEFVGSASNRCHIVGEYLHQDKT